MNYINKLATDNEQIKITTDLLNLKMKSPITAYELSSDEYFVKAKTCN